MFIGEGPFDERLVPHLRRCCVLAGADEADGITVPFTKLEGRIGHSIPEKLAAALKYESDVNLLIVHRDSDSRDPEPRYEEIHRAVSEVSHSLKYVPVVPIQETEAWLLLDEQAIRNIADNPRGTIQLNLPAANRVEDIPSPKEFLHRTILKASEQTGRRYRRIEQKISQKCGLMLDALDPEGPVKDVPSWRRMFVDLKSAISTLSTSNSL
ncbi:protein of unknown function [Rubrobacter radiotolerans DSM 5868]|nr:protein of unknown function [Rubrobacter radiotolerans DSM 5868]